MAIGTENSDNESCLDLAGCRRCVLDHQLVALRQVSTKFQKDNSNGDILTVDQIQKRLGGLQNEPDLSPELGLAMEDMNDAARVGLACYVLYNEEKQLETSSSRILQDEGRLERTKLMEYFVLCKSSLKLQCVVKFMSMKSSGDSIFEKKDTESKEPTSSSMMFPQSRLEHVQRLLAKGLGWNPVFVTSELTKIFVEKSGDIDYDYYDNEVMVMFQQLVEQMKIAIQTAMLQIRSRQDTELLNDLSKGGNTRVVSVQYSEFEVDQNGTKIESKNNAPEKNIDERQHLTEEDQKRQLRMASEAAIMQQSILGELLSMDEDKRNHALWEASEASSKFMKEVMALPMGQERIDYLRSIDPLTSRKLAMHKLWEGMLQANGGKPPKMAPPK